MVLCKIGLHSWRVYQKSGNDIVMSYICGRCRKIKLTKAIKNLQRTRADVPDTSGVA
jgi:hypothetical protein